MDDRSFEETEYFRNARQAMEIGGSYIGSAGMTGIRAVADRFLRQFEGEDLSRLPPQENQSSPGGLVTVRAIRESDCFEVVDGHHRAAIGAVRGDERILVEILPGKVITPLQRLLLDVPWQKGRRELYQPVEAPEIEERWILVRRCVDRFEKMAGFLANADPEITAGSTYIDLGASYGWFVRNMADRGFDSFGVERDGSASQVGEIVYGVSRDRVFQSDLVDFLGRNTKTYDIVSCLSVLHHFARGRGSVSAKELMRRIDSMTGSVLFLETGQNHEAWFRDSLPEWSADYVADWILEHSSFAKVIPLGTDEDAVPPFEENYRRMLFACVR